MNEASPRFTPAPPARRVPVIDNALIQPLAMQAMEAGEGGQAAVGVAAVLHGEGATTIACSLAAYVARSLGQRVVLVDANQRSPALRQVFGLAQGPGLADVLRGEAPLEDALCVPGKGPSGDGRLLVMPAGTGQRIPVGQLAGITEELTAALLGYAELLVFDLAPLQPYPDSALLARHLDGTVVVLQAERANWDTSTAAVQALRDGGANLLGAVLNRRRSYLPWFLERLLPGTP